MPIGTAAAMIVGSQLVGGAMAGDAQTDAANAAAGAQIASSQASIAEQRRQFDAIRELLAPYVSAGTSSIGAQQNLLGLGGPGAQSSAIAGLEQSPQFAALMQQGENAILQNASATGGLRGGNTQGALAQFRPQLLSQLIDQQYNRLGGLTGMGQASAAGQAAAGQNMSNSISNLLGQQGQAQAGAALAAGQGQANMWSGIGSSIGTLGMMNAMKVF